jgi:UDP-GlcNAc:undecaprenyl-phosphate GlcNAc-1-phosphate transferase
MDFFTTMSLAIITGFVFSLLSIKLLKPLAYKLGLVDVPNQRKQHADVTPLIGGLSIFCAVFIGSLLILPITLELRLFLIASALMVTIGALDDRYDVSVRIRIITQIIIASLMIFGVDVYISDLGNIFYFGNINLRWFSIAFTFLSILAAINAFNMVDGIDGLVGTLSLNAFISIIILILFSSYSPTTHHNFELVIATLIAIAIVPYLIFNLANSNSRLKKVFMGDAGSMFIGLSVIWLIAASTQGDNPAFRPVAALWIIAVPIIDMLAIIVRRMRRGENPFKPDRDHLHHIFMRVGFSDREALVVISFFSTLMCLIGVMGELYLVPEYIMMVLFLLVFPIYFFLIKRIYKVSKYILAVVRKII